MSRRSSSPQLALSAVGLEKTYGELVALAPMNLSIADGESVALIGHNGSGKTTMIRMLAGLLEPSDGKIDIYGAPAGSERARAALSYLPDNPVLYDDLSLWEHAEYIAKLHGHAEWSDDATFLADKFGLTGRVDDLPVTFSRGLRQKASLML
jgi:ABC-2 type transport system ATP-binding protein